MTPTTPVHNTKITYTTGVVRPVRLTDRYAIKAAREDAVSQVVRALNAFAYEGL